MITKTSNSFVEELGRSIVNQLSKDIIDVNQCNSSFSVGFWVAITKNGKNVVGVGKSYEELMEKLKGGNYKIRKVFGRPN